MIATIDSISQGTIDDIFDTFVDAQIMGEPMPLVFSKLVWALTYANRRGELAELAGSEEFTEALAWNITTAEANAEALLNA